MAMNLSGASLNDEKFVADAFAILAQHKRAATRLCVEITETVALHDLGNTTRFIDRLRAYGAKIALDDFGAGYTSFSYLKELHADAVKIDGSLVRGVNVHPANLAIVEGIVELARNLGMNIVSANGHSEAFLMVESGRAVAFAMDDILLAGLVASSKTPGDFAIAPEALSVEPYGMIVRKDDVAFKKSVDAAITGLFKSGEIDKIYAKWFMAPVPPKGIVMNVPMSAQLKKVIANPTSSGDPKDYQ